MGGDDQKSAHSKGRYAQALEKGGDPERKPYNGPSRKGQGALGKERKGQVDLRMKGVRNWGRKRDNVAAGVEKIDEEKKKRSGIWSARPQGKRGRGQTHRGIRTRGAKKKKKNEKACGIRKIKRGKTRVIWRVTFKSGGAGSDGERNREGRIRGQWVRKLGTSKNERCTARKKRKLDPHKSSQKNVPILSCWGRRMLVKEGVKDVLNVTARGKRGGGKKKTRTEREVNTAA